MKQNLPTLPLLLTVCAVLLSPIFGHAQNLLSNGDFSGGNAGFTSGYTFVASGQSQTPGTYGIRTNSQDFNSQYNAFGDHSTGTGNMLMVDGSTTPNTVVWSETVSVATNENYSFSAFATASDSGNVPTLRFFINGAQVGADFGLSTTAGQWQQFQATWNSGAAASATLSVVDETLVSIGNDFALDDFSFSSASGTAFTYQGQLDDGARPANGAYDLQFTLFGVSSGGTPIAGPFLQLATVVNNGLFNVLLDFGSQFPGAPRFLEIAVRTNGASAFTTLSPRQALTPTPYALTAQNVVGLTVQSNTNGAPNVISGAVGNSISNGVVGATIAGGGAVNFQGAAFSNTVTVNFGTVGGGRNNTASGDSATVAGGFDNTAGKDSATVGGGFNNVASNGSSTVSGGFNNTASGDVSTVGGGGGNTANGNDSVVSGGESNVAGKTDATVGGGAVNEANGVYSTVSGGVQNTALGMASAVPGGFGNDASGSYSFAAGFGANDSGFNGSFVWNDSTGTASALKPNNTNQFVINAQGGIQLNPDTSIFFNSQTRQMLNLFGTSFGVGVQADCEYFRSGPNNGFFAWYAGGVHSDTFLDPGSGGTTLMTLAASGMHINENVTVNGTVTSSSDRNAKQNFTPVSPSEILSKVTALPISGWNYKQDLDVNHIGPMAQDFYAAFNVGADDKHIALLDEGGVALAAIQGLNQKLETDAQTKDAEIAALKQSVAELKQMVQSLVQKK